MRTVSDILSDAKNSMVTLKPEDSVFEALNAMAVHNLGAIVVAQDGRLVGVFSERDFTRKVLMAQKQPEAVTLREVMSTDVVSASPEMSAEECLSRMNRRGVRHMPVVKDGYLHGFITILQVVDAVLVERDLKINHLERYVSETWPL